MLPVLSQIKIAAPVEPYAKPDLPKICDPTAKPGVVKFKKSILKHQGGGSYGPHDASGIVRACTPGGTVTSHHHEGRGWDWQVDADKPADQERVAEAIAWLFAPGPTGAVHEMLRRAGIRYIIWDKRIWSTGSQGWKPYTRTGNKTIEHRDHVHFSFSKAGANAQTSLYPWIDNDQPVTPPGTDPPPIIPLDAKSLLTAQAMIPMAFGVVLGLATVAAIYRS
jgi:hypothetical protein